ncbi:MAG: hypothetical protein GXW90_02225 [Tepidanaerobacter acetatoxydans]|uniref:hypothetical protein n=1 Tax=Tepidanaerobacter acetatoxydans TaxID=499229 RepID=UPI0026F10A4B|nr:hypothetical protein [Tepidanaerobacter acetatoxydans]NLU09754.1 hypothetical protein [Tepidanaerobacter acetatoxydans]
MEFLGTFLSGDVQHFQKMPFPTEAEKGILILTYKNASNLAGLAGPDLKVLHLASFIYFFKYTTRWSCCQIKNIY